MNFSNQLEQLLSKQRIKEKLSNKIDEWIESFEEKLNKLPELEPTDLDKWQTLLQDVAFPVDDSECKVEASFLFKPPKVHVIGSYALNCISRWNDSHFEVDLALEIPPTCWQRHDYLNYVYHRKRALYLAYIAKQLAAFEMTSSVQFKYQNSDHWKPVVVARASGKLASYVTFIITAFPSEAKSFLPQRFHFSKLNIRDDEAVKCYKLQSSPFYNSSILYDLLSVNFVENLREEFENSKNVQDALILLKIWLENRSLRNHFSHILTFFTYHLLKDGQLNSNLSGFQIFKTILHFISLSSWDKKAVVCNGDETNTEVLEYFPVGLLDQQSFLNLCFNISIDYYERLKYDAESTLDHFNSSNFSIKNTFAFKGDFYQFFDYLINISADNFKISNIKKDKLADNGFDVTKTIISEIIRLIKKTVGDRILLIQHIQPISGEWNINQNPVASSVKFVTFGIMIQNETAFEPIIKGPLANQPEAKEFRDFWGNKSEIRRFQNGDIREAVYWDCGSVQSRRTIIFEAIKYILNRKLHFKFNSITSTFGYLDFLLECKSIRFEDEKLHYNTGEQFISMIGQNMNKLKKNLHDLSELSFSIIDIVGIDSALRATEVFPVFPINSKPKQSKFYCNTFEVDDLGERLYYVKPFKLIVKIELDSKLIQSVEAVRKQKYLLYYELGRKITQTYNLVIRLSSSYLDVFFNGYVFRIILAIGKEIAIHRQISSNTKMVQAVDSPVADQIEFETQVLPSISSSLNTVAQDNISFSLACRLFKRWLSLQMIKHFFHEVTLDLLAAYAYQHYSEFCPNSHITGFLHILRFIVEFDFSTNALIYNFNNNLSSERINAIRDGFATDRGNFPPIFIVTPYDRKLSYHTRSTPNNLIVYHLKKIAKCLLDSLTQSIRLFKSFDLKHLFKADLNMFDIIIKLNTKQLMCKYQSLDFPSSISIKQPLYIENSDHAMPITDYNPAMIYLESLKKAYGNLSLFFFDEFGGKEIGVLLKPQSLESKPFQLSSIEASMLAATSTSLATDNITLNLAALVEDFKVLGEDLVDSVLVKSDKILCEN